MRLFVAWSAPESLAGEIDAHLARARLDLPRASWTRPGQFHVTLAFIGEQKEMNVGPLKDALAMSIPTIARFELRVGDVGSFPNERRPRVVWLGMAAQELETLAGVARNAILQSGVDYDRKPFRAHLTLARTKERWSGDDVGRVSSALLPLQGRVSAVDSIALYSSVLGNRGARHEVLQRFNLG